MLKKQDAQWQIALRTCREILGLSLEFPDVIGYDRVLLLALSGLNSNARDSKELTSIGQQLKSFS